VQSLNSFIVKPYKGRYNNELESGLITNASIESFQHISKEAIVVETPKNIKSPIKKGDIVMVHHNIFRRYYGMNGKQKNSSTYFKDDLYFAYIDQVYLYKQNGKWRPNLNYCFVIPIKETDILKSQKEQTNTGILKYGNSELEALKINPGDLVGFNPMREFEFIFDNKRLYCMKSNDIVVKYEHKGNEEEYNPSWAKSS